MRPNVQRPHWSYSSLNQFLKCPPQYYFERVLGLSRRITTDAQVLGSAIHAALAEHHKGLMDAKPISAPRIQQAFLASWSDQTDGRDVVYDKYSPDDAKDLGIALIETYLGEPQPENIVAVEAPMLTPIADSRGEVLEKPLLAVADLIIRTSDNTPKVVEIKTAGRSFSESEVASSLQATCYASALYELTGEEPLVEYAVLVKTKTPKVQRIETIRTLADFGRLGDVAGVVERAVEAEIFYPVESPLNCSSCPFHRECRSWTGPRSEELEEGEIPVAGEVALAR